MDESEQHIKDLKESTYLGTASDPVSPDQVHVVIIPRERWEATPLLDGAVKPNKRPATCVCFTYLTGLWSRDWADMNSSLRSIKKMQSYYMANGLPDIPYSFIITNDCRIYEGRGWNYKPDVKNKSHSVIDIAFAQNSDLKSLEERPLLFKLLETSLQLVHFGVHHDYISNDYYTIKRNVDERAVFPF